MWPFEKKKFDEEEAIRIVCRKCRKCGSEGEVEYDCYYGATSCSKCSKLNRYRFFEEKNRKELDYIWDKSIDEKGVEWYKVARDKAIKRYIAEFKKKNAKKKKKKEDMIKRIEGWK